MSSFFTAENIKVFAIFQDRKFKLTLANNFVKFLTTRAFQMNVRVENEWLCIGAVSFVFIYLDLMLNHPFSTLPVAISQQCCIDNQNIHNTNNHMCLSCVHDDMLNF